MTAPYCLKCKERPEGRESVDGENARAGTEVDGARGRSDFVEERGEVETERDCCERVFRGERHLTRCDWEHYLELGH